MLKNYGYGGAYHDDNMSVSVLLENPLEYSLDVTNLVFSVIIRASNNMVIVPRLEDFTFYIMEETETMHSAQTIPYLKLDSGMTFEDDEPVRKPDGLIITDFNHKFLFQELRVAFSYRHYEKIKIIDLKH